MENEELKNKLIEKLEREVNEFKDTLRGLSADEIMDNSYKLTCIIEMKDYLIYNKELSKFELKTLLKREDILEECYDDWLSCEENRNFDHIKKDKVESMKSNRIIEKRIRLGRSVKNLELKPYKNGKQDEIKFIYNLKKEVYHKYIEEIYGEWNEENQNKLFNKFMKENSKNIELIYLNDKLVGFYNGKNKDDNTFEIANICIMPEYQNNGIGTAVLKEILFENNDKDVFLQCFKENLAIKLFERIEFGKIMETEQHYIMKKIKK